MNSTYSKSSKTHSHIQQAITCQTDSTVDAPQNKNFFIIFQYNSLVNMTSYLFNTQTVSFMHYGNKQILATKLLSGILQQLIY